MVYRIALLISFSITLLQHFGAAQGDLEIKEVNGSDYHVNILFTCPFNQDAAKISVDYRENVGVDVFKEYDKQSNSFHSIRIGIECSILLKMEGLVPLRLYQMCFSMTTEDEREDYGPICREVKTVGIIRDYGDEVTLNLEGVALVVMIGMSLMLVLMVCVFYDKCVSARFASLQMSCSKCLSKPRTLWEKRMEKRNRKNKPENPVTQESNNGDVVGIKVEETTGEVTTKSGSISNDSITDEQDKIIREALRMRPEIMKSMKPKKTRMHLAPKENLGFELEDRGPIQAKSVNESGSSRPMLYRD